MSTLTSSPLLSVDCIQCYVRLGLNLENPKETTWEVYKEQFERDFLNTKVPDDELEIARKNNDENKRRYLAANLSRDGKEAVTQYISRQATNMSYTGQVPPQNILNPLAWAEFIKEWKRGDFKNKGATPPPTDNN